MKKIIFLYRGASVHIVRGADVKGREIYHIFISGHYLFFVSNADTAKRLAINFIDVVADSADKQQFKKFRVINNLPGFKK